MSFGWMRASTVGRRSLDSLGGETSIEFLQAEREMVCKTLPDGRVVWRHEKEVMRGHLNPNPHPNPKPKPKPNSYTNESSQPVVNPTPNPNPNPNPSPNPNPNPNGEPEPERGDARALRAAARAGAVDQRRGQQPAALPIHLAPVVQGAGTDLHVHCI